MRDTLSSCDMDSEQKLREQLRKIEALFAGAATPGERDAAGAAAERLRARLAQSARAESAVELRFSVSDPWARQLFIALARRYGLRPYRYRRMQRQTLVLRGPRSFIETVLWPEFRELNQALSTYLAEVTERVIREAVHNETADAEELDEPPRLGG
jgi:hypothetical protein